MTKTTRSVVIAAIIGSVLVMGHLMSLHQKNTKQDSIESYYQSQGLKLIP